MVPYGTEGRPTNQYDTSLFIIIKEEPTGGIKIILYEILRTGVSSYET